MLDKTKGVDLLVLGDSMSIDRYPGLDYKERNGTTAPATDLGAGSLLWENNDTLFPDFTGRDLSRNIEYGRFINLSRDGGTLDSLPIQMRQIPKRFGKEQVVVTLTVGGNDLLVALSISKTHADFEKEVARIMDAYADAIMELKERLPNAVILTNTIYDPTDDTGKMPNQEGRLPIEYLKQVNEEIRDTAGYHENVILCDIYETFLGKGVSVMLEKEKDAKGRDVLNKDGLYWDGGIIEPNMYGASTIRGLWVDALGL